MNVRAFCPPFREKVWKYRADRDKITTISFALRSGKRRRVILDKIDLSKKVDKKTYDEKRDELETKLLEEAKLRINPGSIYGEAGRDFIRLNIACPRKLLAEGLDRSRKVLKG